jgi:CDP-diacylglycerol--serine O-phosphatidyltransferase
MTKNALPNLFTLSNLSFGLLSLIMTYEGNYKLACFFILTAGIIDRYDGRVARFFNVSSDLGKELDSLSDLVSFGVAPSILLFNMFQFINLGIIGYILLLIFPIAGAYRLARYNASSFDGVFTGIPITAAGTFMALYALLYSGDSAKNPLGITIILLVIMSYLMVSNYKFKKF